MQIKFLDREQEVERETRDTLESHLKRKLELKEREYISLIASN